ncbi:MAG: hypothetical protein IPP74_04665 [Alphaproteobacteria bacterium]|nr:hypothetical protein [Alphaproteobacteria bacterium]
MIDNFADIFLSHLPASPNSRVTGVTRVTEPVKPNHFNRCSDSESLPIPQSQCGTRVTNPTYSVTHVTHDENDMGNGSTLIEPFKNKASKDVLPMLHTLPIKKKEQVKELSYLSIDIEERAAFIEYEANIPREWAEAFARLEYMEAPPSIPRQRWQKITNNTGILLDKHVHDLTKHRWTVIDIFGVHRTCTDKRCEQMGLLYLLGDEAFYEIKDSSITIRTFTGALQIFQKQSLFENEQTLIWNIHEHGGNDHD